MRLATALMLAFASAARADLAPPFPLDGGIGGMAGGLLFAAAACTSWWATRPIQPGTTSRAVRGGVTIALVVAGIACYLVGLQEVNAERARRNAERLQQRSQPRR